MKYIYYLRYFFFIALNWNPRLAWYTVMHEIRGEKKYGINTSRMDDLKKLQLKGNIHEAEIYQGANYFLIEHLLEKLQSFEVNESIIDFGCGKGRVLAVAAFYGFTNITGIEFAKELFFEAKKNIAGVQQLFPDTIFNIIYTNAIDYQIGVDTNVFFFFNPFNEQVMLSVVKNILLSIRKWPRKVYVLFINPVHKEIFMSAGFEEIYFYEKLVYIQGSILVKDVDNDL